MKTFINFKKELAEFIAAYPKIKETYALTDESAFHAHGLISSNHGIQIYIPEDINLCYVQYVRKHPHVFCDRLSVKMIESSKLLTKHTPLFVTIDGYRVLSKPALKILCKEMIAFGGDKVRDKYEQYLKLLSTRKIHIEDSGMFTGCIPTIQNKIQPVSSIVQ